MSFLIAGFDDTPCLTEQVDILAEPREGGTCVDRIEGDSYSDHTVGDIGTEEVVGVSCAGPVRDNCAELEERLSYVNPVVLMNNLPTNFQNLKVPTFVVQSETNSFDSFKKALEMAKYGNTYIQSGPRLLKHNIEFYVKSAENDNVYTILICPNRLMKVKTARDYYKQFVYKCSCPSKKFNNAKFCKHLSYVLLIYFSKV